LIFIPGLGEIKRLEATIDNLKYLASFNNFVENWDCIVYIYDDQLNTSTLEPYCEPIVMHNNLISDSMKMLTPLIMSDNGYEYIFLLLDDIKLCVKETEVSNLMQLEYAHKHRLEMRDYCNFNLSHVVDIMTSNNLTLVQPRVIGAAVNKFQPWRAMTSAPLSVNGTAGCLFPNLEMFAYIMTQDGYSALWDLILPDINPYGWGYGYWYNGYATHINPYHKMGVISIFEVIHTHAFGGSKADSASNTKKLKCMYSQESYFKKNYNISLSDMRMNTNHPDTFNYNNAEIKQCSSVINL